ncbi:2-phosphosulfolactate phosphatase [Streptomyces sp. NPDC048717]|uniref:2-phosphosulfolactate phosphatase n=1 Tax=Streptomyces sp. NPDC048717 TaxID=3154928 RepID=UPI00344439FE
MTHRFTGIPEPAVASAAGPAPARTADIAVVIDVMRAFTVAAWAFARGAERIVLAETDRSALQRKAAHPDWLALKDGAPAPGFDLLNSPGLIRSADLTGRTLIQRTTAGTRGALAVAHAPLVLCASFAVAGATARVLQSEGDTRQVTFVITGEDGHAEEDLACAHYISRRAHLAPADAAPPDPEPYLHRARTSRAAGELAEGLRRGYRGVHRDDIELCLETDRFPYAMAVRREGAMTVLRPVHLMAPASPQGQRCGPGRADTVDRPGPHRGAWDATRSR